MITCLPSISKPKYFYATNEVEAVREKGLSDSIRIMTIDGSCNGVAEVYDGGFDANIIQQPGLMAQIGLGLDAVKAFLETGCDTSKAPRDLQRHRLDLQLRSRGMPMQRYRLS